MPDPGYGPNGVRLTSVGRISWDANAPPEVMIPGEERWTIYPLGKVPLPFISQKDDEGKTFNYIGGVL